MQRLLNILDRYSMFSVFKLYKIVRFLNKMKSYGRHHLQLTQYNSRFIQDHFNFQNIENMEMSDVISQFEKFITPPNLVFMTPSRIMKARCTI